MVAQSAAHTGGGTIQQDTAKELSLGKKLSILAKLKGFTQDKIAKECTMSRISVNRFFRDHTEIRASDLGAVLNILGINLNQMIDRAIEKQMHGETGLVPKAPDDLNP